jgi:hypothetical protein
MLRRARTASMPFRSLLSDHLSSKDQLTQYSHELRNGKNLSVPREALVQALDALKDPQLLAMLGAQAATR